MMNEVLAAGYLGGLIDGEGHVRVYVNRSVSISNTEWDIIQKAVEACVVLGLKHRISKMSAPRGNRKQCWEVFIVGKASLQRLEEIVPIGSRRKAAALADAIASYRYPKETAYPPREWVEQKYWDEGMSLNQMAWTWGSKSGTHALMWMRFYGIPTRSLSESAVNRWNKEMASDG